ncbi:MAG: hypothetical protein MUO40_11140 [Anaerolineaceae bacterium]|nr:hypothetical protein [Anaerolineaceae bacterium]
MLNAYVLWVTNNPILSAVIQFGLLGTTGEAISLSLKNKKVSLPGTWFQTFLKVIAWAVLGVIIKIGFTGMKGFVSALIEHQLLPASFGKGFFWAFSVSVITNVLFGPQMMAFHRLEDNLIMRQKGFDGIVLAWKTLIWFWIPAHTITFLLPAQFQIGLAALWSIALGIIMGTTKQVKAEP